MRKYSLLLILIVGWGYAKAQQPFEKYGYKVKIATLSKGKYVEAFDQDTVVQIGTVMMNRRTGKILSFVTYDTVRRESDLQPELISRWWSPDPLAEEFYDESPYNFVHNNPIRFVDPDGNAPLDDYYALIKSTLVFLGSDGQGNNIRLVNEGQHDEALPMLNGSATTDEQRSSLRSTDVSQIVTFNESNVNDELQGANDRTAQSGRENSALLTLDPSTATVGAQPGAQGSTKKVANSLKSFDGGTGSWTTDGSKLVVGIAHGHPSQTDGTENAPGYSRDDSNSARNDGVTTFAIDTYSAGEGGAATIHQASPSGRAGVNPVGTTKSATDIGRRAFINVAIPYKKP